LQAEEGATDWHSRRASATGPAMFDVGYFPPNTPQID
jgi:hypothetical protein